MTSIQQFNTFLCNSHNYYPRGAVDDPMYCCPRPKAKGNSVFGHPQHRGGDLVYTIAQKVMKYSFYYPIQNSIKYQLRNPDIDARMVRLRRSTFINNGGYAV